MSAKSIQIIGKEIIGGGDGGGDGTAARGTEGDDTWQNVFTRLSAFALNMAYCEKTRYVEISNSLQLP